MVERLPAYAPELHPVGGLRFSLTAVGLANLTLATLAQVIDRPTAASTGSTAPPHLAYSFPRHAGLSVA